MKLPTFTELYAKLRTSDETVQLEAKTAENDIGKSIQNTVSAFSNEPNRGGGFILFGVAPSSDPIVGDYEVRGVNDSDKTQTEFATQCSNLFNITVRPVMEVDQFNGKNVIVAYIRQL